MVERLTEHSEHSNIEKPPKPSRGWARHTRKEKAAGRKAELPRPVISEGDRIRDKISQIGLKIEAPETDVYRRAELEIERIWWRERAGDIDREVRMHEIAAIRGRLGYWSGINDWLDEIDEDGVSRATSIMQKVYPPLLKKQTRR